MKQQQTLTKFFSKSNKFEKNINFDEIKRHNEEKDTLVISKDFKKKKNLQFIDNNLSYPEKKKKKTNFNEIKKTEIKVDDLKNCNNTTDNEKTDLDNDLKDTENTYQNDNMKESSTIFYFEFTKILDQIENTSSRLKMISIVKDFFYKILKNSPIKTLIKVVYLFINRIGPDYVLNLELGLGESLLIKTFSECYGQSVLSLKKKYSKIGDLGLLAQNLRIQQSLMIKSELLTIDCVFDSFKKIANTTGKDSQAKKISIIKKILTACNKDTNETKFIIRLLEGKLRIGFSEKTILNCLSQAFYLYSLKENELIDIEKNLQAESIMKSAFSLTPNYEFIILQTFEHGIFNLLNHCMLTPGIPVKPMLAKPTKKISEIFDKFPNEEFTCEYKYDGERAQIHLLECDTLKVYSRNSEDMSQKYPELISIIKNALNVSKNITSLIIDCEAVAWNKIEKRILPFQILSTRKRKEVKEDDIKVHICLFVFDLLHLNGESLITKTLSERRKLMEESFKITNGSFQFVEKINTSCLEDVNNFFTKSAKNSCEGIMIKALNGPESFYEPSKRSRNWLKLKKDYLTGICDSLDLIVIGGYFGKGKRKGVFGGFLLASYNHDFDEYEVACKIGSGFSDEILIEIQQKLETLEIKEPKNYYVYDYGNSSIVPDVWFEPVLIFEIMASDFSLSPVYKVGHQIYEKGISLRFPRFIRIREDKSPSDITKSSEIIEFYEKQMIV